MVKAANIVKLLFVEVRCLFSYIGEDVIHTHGFPITTAPLICERQNQIWWFPYLIRLLLRN